MIGDNKEVYFDQYCPKCVSFNDSETDPKSPCWDCVNTPVNQDSHKPINFKEASENEKQVSGKANGQ